MAPLNPFETTRNFNANRPRWLVCNWILAVEGGQVAKRRKAPLASSCAWAFAGVAAGIATVLNLLLAFAGPRVAPEFAKLAIAPVSSGQFWVLLAVYAGGYVIANRFFYGLGASNQLRLMRQRGEAQ